ncbi:hypothetical protein OsJ_17737 [Oryza sativa Japonica Group]|uniref:non-specific serine/threonine protein kinase n=1 Tax=Oryza sativa subsp. japonica TaxID=39947 RepID=B9FNE5_ORYSJ|nr:hypothetical protein OsJ_17737 [Oryza sativa Japonica Group]
MEDGMDFSPHKNSTEQNRTSFEEDDQFSIRSAPSKPSPDKKSKPKNKPNHHSDKTANPPPQRPETTAALVTTTAAAATAGTNRGEGRQQRQPGQHQQRQHTEQQPGEQQHRRRGGANGADDIGVDGVGVGVGAEREAAHRRGQPRLGYGDIGSVYLVELRGTSAFFAMKVMDKASIASRNKMARAETEREILGLLDHPFLPTLYTHFETDKFYCLVMEYCSGGNLHSLRQKQPSKHFSEPAARFYVAEVLLALEYLHMLGIVYRDLKPENVLVRDDGHIMLSDFDLSLRCTVCPTLVKSSSVHATGSGGGIGSRGDAIDGGESMPANQGCIQPSSFFPRILPRRSRKASKSDMGLLLNGAAAVEFNAEPTEARSMSFVGTHEYLAPEIIRGEGHGSAVDWWTLGIFLYELIHGATPFKGAGNRATLCNVIEQPLRFPSDGGASAVARDLIRGLLVKEPHKRIAFTRGATEIKQHPFFDGVNWALVRSLTPPSVPEPVDFRQYAAAASATTPKDKKPPENAAAAAAPAAADGGGAANSSTGESYTDFEYF